MSVVPRIAKMTRAMTSTDRPTDDGIDVSAFPGPSVEWTNRVQMLLLRSKQAHSQRFYAPAPFRDVTGLVSLSQQRAAATATAAAAVAAKTKCVSAYGG